MTIPAVAIAATIVSAVLQDIGIVDDGDLSSVIDRSKIRRERQKHRKQLVSVSDKVQVIEGLYFYGRKDKTREQKLIDNKCENI